MFTGVWPTLPVITTKQWPILGREIRGIEEVARGTARDLPPKIPVAVFRNGCVNCDVRVVSSDIPWTQRTLRGRWTEPAEAPHRTRGSGAGAGSSLL